MNGVELNMNDDNIPLAIPRLGLSKAAFSAPRPRRRSSLDSTPENPPELIERIGKGSYGSVWSARQQKLGEVAVKIVALPQDLHETASLEKEINLMRTFDHASSSLR